MTRKRFDVLVAAVCLFVGVGRTYAGSIGGVVKDRSGKPVSGALVRIKNPLQALTITVVSQERGRYDAADLPSGKYTVHSFGNGSQSEDATVHLEGSQSAMLDLDLKLPIDYKNNVSMTDFATLMPEAEAKEIILSRCTECHHPNELGEVVYARKSRDGWKEALAKVRDHSGNSLNGLIFSQYVPQQQKDLVLDYLAQHFGPHVPPFDPGKLPKTLVNGAAAKVVITEINLWPDSRPHEAAVDRNGVGWVTERGHGILGRYDPLAHRYDRISLPPTTRPGGGFAVDPQGRVWIADDANARFIQYEPKMGTFSFYPYPESPTARPGINVIRFHQDGTVWGTALPSSRVLRLHPATKEITQYHPPTAVAEKRNVKPYGMAIDGSNAVWFAEELTGKVARIDPKTGEISEYDVPTKPPVSSLRRMATDRDGNIWYPDYGGGTIGMIDYRTRRFTEYPTPTKDSGPYSIDVDTTNHFIWVAETTADQIARFDPRTKTWVEYPVPTRNSSVRRIEVDPSRPNRIWFSGNYTDTLGYLDISE